MPKRKNKGYKQQEEKTVHKQGKPWATVAVFNSYDEADKHRNDVLANEPIFSTKVKRCGTAGSQFKVIKRINEQLAKVAEELDKAVEAQKLKKTRTKKKTKAKTKK